MGCCAGHWLDLLCWLLLLLSLTQPTAMHKPVSDHACWRPCVVVDSGASPLLLLCLVCRQVAEDSIKNYQLWNHRRKIALALGPAAAEQELQFCTGELRTHCVLGARDTALRFSKALCCHSAPNPRAAAQKACSCMNTHMRALRACLPCRSS